MKFKIVLLFVGITLHFLAKAQTDTLQVDTTEAKSPKLLHHLQGNIGLEATYFYDSPFLPSQESGQVSLLVNLNYQAWTKNQRLKLIIKPYLRITAFDKSRSHIDLREGYLLYSAKSWDAKMGFQNISSGFAQGFSVMNVINQTDDLEVPWSPVALGQPMINLGYLKKNFAFRAMAMPFFRVKKLPDFDSRLNIYPLPINTQNAKIESNNVSWAIKLSDKFLADKLETEVIYFEGLSNTPYIIPTPDFSSLNLNYLRMNYLGLSSQYVWKSLVVKGEYAYRRQNNQEYWGGMVGFEYPFANIGGSAIEMNLFAEYFYDAWRDKNHFPFSKIALLGNRVDFGDIQSTTLYMKMLLLPTENTFNRLFVNLEISRRMMNHWETKISWVSYIGQAIPKTEPLTVMQHVNNVTISLNRFF
ncbi:hypothetical protein LV89_04339 [Arcicella aurantiaca]|uniref:Capsule assembly protein Wzi n=1 Tax=Arcicella aurantiaca TaxID=591202 RepID=A0A316DLK9_9BACT|nr:hypothetical protein [Arcicella aurantiaca]PWK17623.1 hypothetical protein LV89_04339 [Arcicella aurantiaca]